MKKVRKSLKIRSLIWMSLIAVAVLAGYSVSASGDGVFDEVRDPWYGSAVGSCGLWVEVGAALNDPDYPDQLDVWAAGGPGPECTWDKLEVKVSFRNERNGLWQYMDGYKGSATEWDDSYSTSGYDRFRIVVKGYDVNDNKTHMVAVSIEDNLP